MSIYTKYGALAQYGRASRLHREGREFESLTLHQINGLRVNTRWLFLFGANKETERPVRQHIAAVGRNPTKLGDVPHGGL